MATWDLNQFCPEVRALLDAERLNPLGPGQADQRARKALESLDHRRLLGGPPVDAEMADACLAALWLDHNFLDVAHAISQRLSDRAGAYWHGIMHRREPDAGNAKYWMRRVGQHSVFAPLASVARQQAQAAESQPGWDRAASFLLDQAQWDPFAWIDLCDAVLGDRAKCLRLCQVVQQREWELLFSHTYRLAAGRRA